MHATRTRSLLKARYMNQNAWWCGTTDGKYREWERVLSIRTIYMADMDLPANHLRCIARWAFIAAATFSKRKYTWPALFLHNIDIKELCKIWLIRILCKSTNKNMCVRERERLQLDHLFWPGAIITIYKQNGESPKMHQYQDTSDYQSNFEMMQSLV